MHFVSYTAQLCLSSSALINGNINGEWVYPRDEVLGCSASVSPEAILSQPPGADDSVLKVGCSGAAAACVGVP